MAVGSLTYCALFLFLSLLTNHAFIVGIIYVFIWESIVTEIFPGTRYISVRHYSRSIAEALANQPEEFLDADLSLVAALVGAAIVTLLAVWLAIRRLRYFDLPGTAA